MKKILSLILFLLISVSLFAACSSRDSATPSEDGTSISEPDSAEETDPSSETEGQSSPETVLPESVETGEESVTLTGSELEPETDEPETDEPDTETEGAESEESATEGPVEELDPRALAFQCIGKSVDELYAAIGYPNDSLYAPSCMGDGDDGELYYSWFTVITYREGGVETVVDVY